MFVVTLLLLPACDDSRQSPSDATPRLHPIAANVIRACRTEQRTQSFPVLCPSRLPRPHVPCPPLSDPGHIKVSTFEDPVAGFYGMEFAYCAPSERTLAQNRPTQFLHFFIGDASFPYSNQGWHHLASRELGGRQGELYFQPNSSYHRDHLVFVWRENGVEYEASLHSWDDRRQAVALLDALIASLKRPFELVVPRRAIQSNDDLSAPRAR